MFVLALSLYNTWNRGVFLLCKITNLLIYSNNIEDKDSKNYSRQRQYLEDKFMNDATKGLDQEQIYYLVKLSLGSEYSAIRNIMLLFLYRKYKDELLNCFVKSGLK